MLLADLPYAHETAAGASQVCFFNPSDPKELKERMKTIPKYSREVSNLDAGTRLLKLNDLYKIFIEICEGKRILKSIPSMEERKGKDHLAEQLQKVATPEAFVEKMQYEPHQKGDVLLITGIGKVYPFMRSHKILDNIQHIFADIPVLMLYPGTFDGQDLGLFGKFLDGHYYRAFNLL